MRRVVPNLIISLLVSSAMIISGCGAIFTGSTTTVPLSTTPAGALVSSNPPSGQMETPTSIVLDKGHDYVLKFEKDGYEPATIMINKRVSAGMVVLDVLFTGLIGVVVDAVTNGWNTHSPSSVNMTLKKAAADASLPEEVHIQGSFADGAMQLESSSPVSVVVEEL